jgi:MFS transporter, PHS family, inorganic phosphate transporter
LSGTDYPLSSAFSVEKDAIASRAIQILLVFASIALGNIAAGTVFLVLLQAFKSLIYTDIQHLEWVWRLLLGLGLIPAMLTLYARLTISETAPYKQCVYRRSAYLSDINY